MCLNRKKIREKMSQGDESLSELNVLTSKRTKKRISFLQSVVDRIEEAIYSECLWKDRMSENIEYKAGWIEISMNSNGGYEGSVCHLDNEHKSPRLEAAIAGMLPYWWSVRTRAEEDEREEQEFRDYLWRNSRYW